MSVTESRDELQGLLVVMASLSHGLEQTLGRGAETVTFRAGRTVGLKSGAGQQESDLMAALAKVGVELNELGHIIVTSEQHTNVPGLYAAGDVTSPHDHQISAAVHEGNQAACAANYFLYRPVQKGSGKEEC